jgi:hypothetical protein
MSAPEIRLPLRFYDHHRQRYAEKVQIPDAGEFQIGDYIEGRERSAATASSRSRWSNCTATAAGRCIRIWRSTARESGRCVGESMPGSSTFWDR